MDKRRGFLNVSISILYKFILLFSSLFVRRMLIKYIGNDVNGLNSLYTSIIGFLSVAELGVGSAITYSMYKPIVDGDIQRIGAIYCLYKKVYIIVGGVILGCGLLLTPFLPCFIENYHSISVNVYLTFLVMLISVVVTYTFSAKISLINAYKNNYITTSIAAISEIVMYALQVLVVVIMRSFILYLLCRIIEALVLWGLTEIYIKRKYSDIVHIKAKIDATTRGEIEKNIKAMFMHKIGGVLVSTIDSVIISSFIGIGILGKYSNYTVIMTSMVGVISLFFTPLTSIIGHLCVESNKEKVYKYFNFFYGFNFILGVVFFLGYYAIIDNLIALAFGDNLEMAKSISFVITLNQFIQFMRKSTLLFRDASGTFYNDRWKPIAEGITNLILSVIFINVFPNEYSVVGVIVATIITTLLICNIVEPFILFKRVFNKKTRYFYFKNYGFICLFALCMIVLDRLLRELDNDLLEMFTNGSISLIISGITFLLLYIADSDFRSGLKTATVTIKMSMKKKDK